VAYKRVVSIVWTTDAAILCNSLRSRSSLLYTQNESLGDDSAIKW